MKPNRGIVTRRLGVCSLPFIQGILTRQLSKPGHYTFDPQQGF
jgi:hypothetical protein